MEHSITKTKQSDGCETQLNCKSDTRLLLVIYAFRKLVTNNILNILMGGFGNLAGDMSFGWKSFRALDRGISGE